MPSARRTPLTLLLALGAALLALGWLASGRVESVPETTYVEAVIGAPVRVNPLAVQTVESEGDLRELVFAGLMRLRADGLPEPELAERWEVTPDGLTYTFHLHEGMTWHDGATLDAYDVAFTIARIQAEGFGGAPDLVTAWAGVQTFVADPLTILVRLPEPSANFLQRATLGIVPEHLAARMDGDVSDFDRHPVGAGPYRLVALDNERGELRANTAYVLGAPAIGHVELRFAEDGAQQLEWLRDGAVDAALLPDAVDRGALAELDDGQAVTEMTRNAYTVLYVNNARAPLNEPALRRALAASIDREALLAAVPGAIEGATVIPPGAWSAPAEEATPPPLEALWALAGWPQGMDGRRQRDGQTLTLEFVTNGEPDRIALAEAIAAQLAAQGVTVEIVPEPAQRVVSDYLQPGEYDLALFGWESAPDLDPYAGWHTSQTTAGNVARFSDAQADALLEAARTTLDVEERRELYGLFLARFEELGASLVIDYPRRPYVHPASLEGFEPRLLLTPGSRFADIHRWRLP